ncbi:hypothetical protein VNTUMSATTG_61130 (plasmid) [Vibrio nigripulchritudo]|nr:hypothetical protein VNTUMSATTG_61130 [Vibrio nigripulchritudo]
MHIWEALQLEDWILMLMVFEADRIPERPGVHTGAGIPVVALAFLVMQPKYS